MLLQRLLPSIDDNGDDSLIPILKLDPAKEKQKKSESEQVWGL